MTARASAALLRSSRSRRPTTSAGGPPQRSGDAPSRRDRGARADRLYEERHGLRLLGELRLPRRAPRSASWERSTPSARGRRFASRTSRWTARSPSTRRGRCSSPATATPLSSTRFGRSSPCQLDRVLALQLDPYYMAPMWPDPIALAALQARAHARRREGDGGGFRGSGRTQPCGGEGQREGRVDRGDEAAQRRRCSRRTSSCPRFAGTPCRRSPTVRPQSCLRPATGPRSSARARLGSQVSTTASRPTHSEPGT